jgi:hypothetical protein
MFCPSSRKVNGWGYYQREGYPDTGRDYAGPAAIDTAVYPRGKHIGDNGKSGRDYGIPAICHGCLSPSFSDA